MEELSPKQIRIEARDRASVDIWINTQDLQISDIPQHLMSTWQSAKLKGKHSSTNLDLAVALGTQIQCALWLTSLADIADTWSPDLLGILIAQGSISSEQALNWIDLMVEPQLRAESVLAIAPFCTKEQSTNLVDVLFSTHPNVGYPTDSNAIFEISESTTPTPSEILTNNRGFAQELNTWAVRGLESLLPHLSEPSRSNAIRWIKSYALSTQVNRERIRLLRAIAPFLSTHEVVECVETASKLPSFRHKSYDDPQSEALMGLLPRYAELGFSKDALDRALHLPAGFLEKPICLAELTGFIPDDHKAEYLAQARTLALAISPVWPRHESLQLIAEKFAAYGLHGEAMATAEQADDPSDRLWIYASLLENLPAALTQSWLTQLVDQGPDFDMTVDARHLTLVAVSRHLVALGRREQALPFIEAIWKSALYWWEMREGTDDLFRGCAQSGMGQPLIDLANGLEYWRHRAIALSVLARHLTGTEQERALRLAKGIAVKTNNWLLLAEAFVKLAQQLPESERAPLVADAIDLAADNRDRDWEDAGRWLQVLQDSANILPACPADIQRRFIDEAMWSAKEWHEFGASDVLWAIARYASLNESLRLLSDAEIEQLLLGSNDSPHDLHALSHLANTFGPNELSQLSGRMKETILSGNTFNLSTPVASIETGPEPDKAHLGELVVSAISNSSGYGYRASALEPTVSWINKLPEADRYAIFANMLWHLSQQRGTVDLLSDIGVLAPVIGALGDLGALKAVWHCIKEHNLQAQSMTLFE